MPGSDHLMRGVNLLTNQGLEIEGRLMTEPDVRRVAGWGMNAIRAGFSGLEDPSNPLSYDEDAFRRLDGCLDWCEKYDLNLILCMWDVDGEWWGSARKPGAIWGDRGLQERFKELWATVAERYRDRPLNLSYELINEPRAPDDGEWNRLSRLATKAIRSVDDRHTVIVESNRWGSTSHFPYLEPNGDPNTLYSFHFYEPIIFTNQKAPWMPTFSQYYRETVSYPGQAPRLEQYIERLPSHADDVVRSDLETSRGTWDKNRLRELLEPVLEFRKKHGYGVFCGEFGVNWRAPRASAINWLSDVLRLFSDQSIGWTYWYYKDLDFGIVDSLKLDHTRPPDYLDRELLDLLKEHI